MIELLVLVVAVCLLAVALRPVIEWLRWIEIERAMERERLRRLLEVCSRFPVGRNAHAVITGITS